MNFIIITERMGKISEGFMPFINTDCRRHNVINTIDKVYCHIVLISGNPEKNKKFHVGISSENRTSPFLSAFPGNGNTFFQRTVKSSILPEFSCILFRVKNDSLHSTFFCNRSRQSIVSTNICPILIVEPILISRHNNSMKKVICEFLEFQTFIQLDLFFKIFPFHPNLTVHTMGKINRFLLSVSSIHLSNPTNHKPVNRSLFFHLLQIGCQKFHCG